METTNTEALSNPEGTIEGALDAMYEPEAEELKVRQMRSRIVPRMTKLKTQPIHNENNNHSPLK